MKKQFLPAVILLIASLLLPGCHKETGSSVSGSPGSSSASETEIKADELADPTDSSREATGNFGITPDQNGVVFSEDGKTCTISSAGEYTVSGSLDGQIVVSAGEDDEVVLVLNNASLTSASSAPILFSSAGSATVRSEEGTYNTVTDTRSRDSSEDEETATDGAIYAACDLKISGKGTLIVTSSCDNGIKSKDDLEIKNVTLKVTSPGCALKGNDSITVESGNLILISTESDGVKTSNSDITSKGNQQGTIRFEGGHTDIHAACDAISAAYDAVIAGEDCTVNVFTSTYADLDGAEASGELYLIVPQSIYSDNVDYYGYFYNEDDTAGMWKRFTYDSMVYGGHTAYYGLTASMPSGYQNFLVNTVPSDTTPDGNNYTATSGGDTLNTSMNGYLITNLTDGEIAGDWVQLSSGSGSSKTTYSSKGIKTSNMILIENGTVVVYSMDDALHANAGELESGASGAGDVTISGGTLTITAADDGIHADNTLTVRGGTVNIIESHEGLEGNVIEIEGGTLFIYGDDDGLNACSGSQATLINITGGYMEVTTPSGDTDAIDSNGSFTMSGGTVLVKGGAASGSMAGSVDVDGSVTVTGGTIVALGGICEIPSNNSVNTYISSGTSFAEGSYILADSAGNEIMSFTLTASYSSCWIASDAFVLNGSYVLKRDGETVLSWTQSSSAEGSAGSMGGFGGGGFGGRGGMGGGRP